MKTTIRRPRLILPGVPARLHDASGGTPIEQAFEMVKQNADRYRQGTVFDYPTTTHNAHLIRARLMQGRVVTLLARWIQTGDAAYRRAVLAHVRQMDRWTHWSWILWRAGNRNRDGIFDLSYGENSTTLAFAWDALQPTLSAAERTMFLNLVRRWSWAAFAARQKAGTNWWFGKRDCNWNTVCAGGLGMLALAMMGDAPEAPGILRQVEKSFRPYMQHLNELDGGWPEGIGYWGYGMRYAFLYLLSWEQTMGREHPLMRLPGVRKTLDFPLDFSPDGVPCSFGDVNRYGVNPFHYALAERFGRGDVVRRLDALYAGGHPSTRQKQESWPNAVELLAFHPRRIRGRTPVQRNVVRRYRTLDWYWMADRWPDPNLYVSIRGGTTEVPHGHLDLTSFHCVAGGEALVTSPHVEYLDTTFSPRRWEIFEMTPGANNVVMINGVGIVRPSTVQSRALKVKGCPAVRLEATAAMGGMRDGRAARFYGRFMMLLGADALLVLDHFELMHFGRMEVRFHTPGAVTVRGAGVRIKGKRRQASLVFDATVPGVVRTGIAPTTSPGPDYQMVRWGTRDLHQGVTFASLLVPGTGRARVEVKADGRRIRVMAVAGNRQYRMVFTDRLIPA